MDTCTFFSTKPALSSIKFKQNSSSEDDGDDEQFDSGPPKKH